MRMRLIDNWWQTLLHGWTPRLIAVGALLNGLYAYTDVMVGIVPTSGLAKINAVLAALTFVLRFIPQKKVSGDKQ
ncbi:MAG: hypothetical protein E5V63_24215 [Mesorhizobium sp.]|nr:MAG: hypothetical protein E5V63_24215 [Mesorhizobium sp.]